MNEELKPCPFCGSNCNIKNNVESYGTIDRTAYSIECENDKCMCAESIGYDKEDVIQRWNTRKEESK